MNYDEPENEPRVTLEIAVAIALVVLFSATVTAVVGVILWAI